MVLNECLSSFKVADLRDDMSEWINKFQWQMWFTGTFKEERSYRDTIKTKKAFMRFIGDLGEKYHKSEIEFWLAVERFKCGDFTHVHALLNGLDGLTYRQIGEVWRSRFGRESVEGYDPQKGANYYLTKYVVKEVCDWDFKILQNKKSECLKFN
jgi:hypothetical protein